MSFADAIKQAEREGQVGTGIWKPQEGPNRIRVVAGPLPHSETYQGEKRFKWLTFVLDRADGQIKPYFMPHSVAKMIRDLQQSEDYAFEGTPMPYDLTLTAKGAGTRDVEYGVVPARKSTPLTKAEEDAIVEKGSLAEFQRKLRERKQDPQKPFDPDEMPA
jgi:hypothetical protein